MDAGGFALSAPFSLRTILDETTRVLPHKRIRRDLSCLPRAGRCAGRHRGDPQRLRQVFANLVGNAIKFTGKGGVTIRVVTSRRQPKRSVCGFPCRIRESAFHRPIKCGSCPFIQADASTTRLFGGTGLGLAIVSELVSMMGGRLWLESELDVKYLPFHRAFRSNRG